MCTDKRGHKEAASRAYFLHSGRSLGTSIPWAGDLIRTQRDKPEGVPVRFQEKVCLRLPEGKGWVFRCENWAGVSRPGPAPPSATGHHPNLKRQEAGSSHGCMQRPSHCPPGVPSGSQRWSEDSDPSPLVLAKDAFFLER